MKKLLQIRISVREMEKTSLEDAILVAIGSHLKESIQVKWSASKLYLLIIENDNISALDFGRQWSTLRNQFIDGRRLKCYLKVEERLVKC